jgi:hypothetical protein
MCAGCKQYHQISAGGASSGIRGSLPHSNRRSDEKSIIARTTRSIGGGGRSRRCIRAKEVSSVKEEEEHEA